MVLLLPALAIAAMVAGTGLRVAGAIGQNRARRDQEALRMKQMNLEADRQRRQTIRQMIVQQSIATSNAYAQGAGSGSGIKGGIFQLTGDAARGVQGVNQNQELGVDMFAANAREGRAATIGMIGSGLSSLGGSILGNMGTFSRVGGG